MQFKDWKDYCKKKAHFKVKEVKPNVFLLRFRSRKEMTSTLHRFQEFYESAKYRNKLFTLKEFFDYNCSQNEGKFKYHTYVDGINFPSSILKSFKFMPALTTKEKQVLSLFENKTCYIIAVVGNDKDTLRHEMCHAFYFLNKSYKHQVQKILKNSNLTIFKDFMKSIDYHKSVHLDEAHAFLCADFLMISKEVDLKPKFKTLSKRLQLNYKLHFNQA